MSEDITTNDVYNKLNEVKMCYPNSSINLGTIDDINYRVSITDNSGTMNYEYKGRDDLMTYFQVLINLSKAKF